MSITIAARAIKAARKRRWCSDCGRSIEPGKPYLYLYGAADASDKPWPLFICNHCVLADMMPDYRAQTGYNWKSIKIRAALEEYAMCIAPVAPR